MPPQAVNPNFEAGLNNCEDDASWALVANDLALADDDENCCLLSISVPACEAGEVRPSPSIFTTFSEFSASEFFSIKILIGELSSFEVEGPWTNRVGLNSIYSRLMGLETSFIGNLDYFPSFLAMSRTFCSAVCSDSSPT